MITVDDFVGKYEVAISFKGKGITLQEFIDDNQEMLLVKLLGKELYDEFVANESEPEFIKIKEPFVEQLRCGDIINSIGMKNMLLSLITAMYRRNVIDTSTAGGQVKLKNEGGENLRDQYTTTYNMYNNGVRAFRNIQRYIIDNRDDYKSFRGQRLLYTSFI